MTVAEKPSLQSAADEARKAARAAREFAGLLDDYAKYLTQPSYRRRADDLHTSALNKLNVVNEGLAASRKWSEQSPVIADPQPVPEIVKSEAREKPPVIEPPAPRAIRVAKKTSSL